MVADASALYLSELIESYVVGAWGRHDDSLERSVGVFRRDSGTLICLRAYYQRSNGLSMKGKQHQARLIASKYGCGGW